MSPATRTVFALSVLAAVASAPAFATQRAFVSSAGVDTNTSLNCTLANPCRSFSAAMTVLDPGGEILALDSVGYGTVTVTKSATITAAPGAYAGITVPSGSGVTIATAGVKVTLRGLVINSLGGTNGILMTDGAKLSIENCVISNFSVSGGHGVAIHAAASVRIADSVIRGNDIGVEFSSNATGGIHNSQIAGNTTTGIYVFGNTTGITNVIVGETVVSGSGTGVYAHEENAASLSRIMVMRSGVNNNTVGIFSEFAGGPTVIGVSETLVTNNGTGLSNGAPGSTLESFGNNTVRYNGPNSGTITTVALQ